MQRALRRYEAAKKKGDYDEETQRREHAKNALERYMHYYQRWAENDRARLKAGPPTAPCIILTAQIASSPDREHALLPALGGE